jgi:hypothetical protein
MSSDGQPVIIIPESRHMELTIDRLPAAPGLLPCAMCGEVRERHWRSDFLDECEGFTRPILPASHRYADTLTPGAWIRRRSHLHEGVQQVRRVTSSTAASSRMMLLQLEAEAPGVSSTSAYLAPDTVVEVVEPAAA